MKILFVTTLDLQIHTFHERIIHALKEQGNTIDSATNGFYTSDTPIGSYKNEDLDHQYLVPFHRNPLHPDNLRAQREVRDLILKNHYDIVSCHSPSAGFYGRKAAEHLDVRVIYTAHGFHFWKGAPLINRTAYKSMEELAAHWTDVLMTINPEDYEAAKKFHYKHGGYPVYIPGIGVDVKAIRNLRCAPSEIRKELGIPDDAFVLYSVGELIHRKNHRFVLESLEQEFHQDPSLHYVIAGFGKLQGELTEYIETHNLKDQVHLLGFRKDARKLMYGMDAFVFPSYQEGLPVAVMEAMAAGLPVIASDIRGNHDLIQDGSNGFLFPVDDAGKFRSCVFRMKKSPELRRKFSAQCMKDSEQYSLEAVEPRILELYEKQ